MRKSQDRSQG